MIVRKIQSYSAQVFQKALMNESLYKAKKKDNNKKIKYNKKKANKKKKSKCTTEQEINDYGYFENTKHYESTKFLDQFQNYRFLPKGQQHGRKSSSFEIDIMKDRIQTQKQKLYQRNLISACKNKREYTKSSTNLLENLFVNKKKDQATLVKPLTCFKKNSLNRKLSKADQMLLKNFDSRKQKYKSKKNKIKQNFSQMDLKINDKYTKYKKGRKTPTNQKIKKFFDIGTLKQIEKVDFSLLFKKEDFLYGFVIAFYEEKDFYTNFQQYIEFYQEHSFQQFLDLLDKNSIDEFRQSIMLEGLNLLISFYLQQTNQLENEIIFLKKQIQSIYSNCACLIYRIFDRYQNHKQIKSQNDNLNILTKREFSKYNITLSDNVKKNNHTIKKYLKGQIKFLDDPISNSIYKFLEFIEDFTLIEGIQNIVELFSKVFQKHGFSEQNKKSIKKKKFSLEIETIQENSSERSSSVHSDSFSKQKKQYILVLDLDETLVHYKEDGSEGKVLFRPYLDEFLEQMNKYFEIMIFTASVEEYADLILDHLDPKNTIISKRFYRKDTDLINNEYTVKDLLKIDRDLSKIIIIDNLPENFKHQPDNGIFINSWYGDENDQCLKDLIPVLQNIVRSECTDKVTNRIG